jgi:hypothetical protein
MSSIFNPSIPTSPRVFRMFDVFICRWSRGVRNPSAPGCIVEMKKPRERLAPPGAFALIGQRPTLPHTRACSTIGAVRLNFRVRDGNGVGPSRYNHPKVVIFRNPVLRSDECERSTLRACSINAICGRWWLRCKCATPRGVGREASNLSDSVLRPTNNLRSHPKSLIRFRAGFRNS